MILIVGGAWQGKLTWAVKEFDLKPSELCDLAVQDPASGFRCYYHLEEWTKRCEDCGPFLPVFTDAVVISREIGSGVVPIEQPLRFWRERHGRFLRKLSAQAERVYRITCELPEKLK